MVGVGVGVGVIIHNFYSFVLLRKRRAFFLHISLRDITVVIAAVTVVIVIVIALVAIMNATLKDQRDGGVALPEWTVESTIH